MSNRYLDAAADAARWVRHHRSEPSPVLYDSTPGEVLLSVVAARVTGAPEHADDVATGLAVLQDLVRDPSAGYGLFAGIAGVGFAMHVAGADAEPAVSALRASASVVDDGVHWGGLTDVISGAAGIALFLVEHDVDLAIAACRWLLAEGERTEDGGLRWGMGGEYAQWPFMPNFSHGTAGIAYTLATVGHRAGDERLVDAALDGARHLLAIARTDGDTCAVRQHVNSTLELYPLGWCHGPTGLVALFRRLELVTGDQEWRTWVERAARTVLTSGIPERREPGFWDNVARCCGSTGVAELFLDLHEAYGDDEALRFATLMSDDILDRSTADDEGTRWSNVEFRADPPVLPPEPGFMQGASGIALWLFRLGSFVEGRQERVSWPWSPFV